MPKLRRLHSVYITCFVGVVLCVVCALGFVVSGSFETKKAFQDRNASTTYTPIRSNNTSARCYLPLCIIAHGDVNDAAIERLRSYSAMHSEVPVLLLTSGTDHVHNLLVWNVGIPMRDTLLVALRDLTGDPVSAQNEIRITVVQLLRPCNIWEMDASAAFLDDSPIIDQIHTRLRPSRPAPSWNKSYYFGARPRETAHSSDPPSIPVLNAYTVFSPETYYSPRGYPVEYMLDDMRGDRPSAPELIRIELKDEENIVVVQSVIDGHPDADRSCRTHRSGKQNTHKPLLHGIIIPPNLFHPYNQLATFHRYDGLWALYLPASEDIGDVLRGYIAQAVLPMVGRAIAVVSPLVIRSRMSADTFSERSSARMHVAAILHQLSHWTRLTLEHCSRQVHGKGACIDAGTLLVSAYDHLERNHIAPKGNAKGAKRWVDRLRSSGYVFPARVGLHPVKVASPTAPRPLNVHAAVHINWGATWKRVVPLWHALHASEYQQVTYHLQNTPNALDPSPVAGVYPHKTYYVSDPPGQTSGYLAFQSATQAWNVHNKSLDALLWTHDDAFVWRGWLSEWLLNTNTCVAKARGHWVLPANSSDWADFGWSWAQDPRVQLSARHFRDIVRGRDTTDKHAHCIDNGMTVGQSDTVAIRTRCNGTEPDLLFDFLQAATDAGLFLEIAWPTSLTCAFSPSQLSSFRLHTRWDEHRNNASVHFSEHMRGNYDVYHPMKFSRELMTRLTMRDESW